MLLGSSIIDLKRGKIGCGLTCKVKIGKCRTTGKIFAIKIMKDVKYKYWKENQKAPRFIMIDRK